LVSHVGAMSEIDFLEVTQGDLFVVDHCIENGASGSDFSRNLDDAEMPVWIFEVAVKFGGALVIMFIETQAKTRDPLVEWSVDFEEDLADLVFFPLRSIEEAQADLVVAVEATIFDCVNEVRINKPLVGVAFVEDLEKEIECPNEAGVSIFFEKIVELLACLEDLRKWSFKRSPRIWNFGSAAKCLKTHRGTDLLSERLLRPVARSRGHGCCGGACC
jgi:hypothetical protein